MRVSSYDLVVDTIQRKRPKRLPVIPIVGLFSMNVSGLSSNEILHDAQKQAKSQLLCQSRFGYDGVFNVMDLTAEVQVLGAQVEFPQRAFPYLKTHPLEEVSNFNELPSLDIESTRLSVFIESIRLMASEIKEKIYLSSYVIGPFTLAGHLIGIDNLMELTAEDGETATALVAHCASIVEPYIEAQVEAGTDNIVILEPTASSSLISPRFFKSFSLPNVKSLVTRIHSHNVGATLHICGKTSNILDMMCKTGADVLSIDSHVNIDEARNIVGDRASLMGIIDTTLMVEGTTEEIALAVSACLSGANRDGGYILSTSCDTPIDVPVENLETLVKSSTSHF